MLRAIHYMLKKRQNYDEFLKKVRVWRCHE
jgi:hypothetical protein